MKRFPRLLLCTLLLATSACSADAIAGPTPAAEAEADVQAVEPAAPETEDAPPVTIFRCVRTFSAPPTEPLYIIDGAISTQRDAQARIDADAIDSIEVLKGAEAGPIYGSRAAAGVIIITTRPPPQPAGS